MVLGELGCDVGRQHPELVYATGACAVRGGVAKMPAGLGGVEVVVRVCRARCVSVASGVVCTP